MAAFSTEPVQRSFRVPRYIRTHFLFSIAASCFLTLLTTIAYFQLQPKVPIFYSLGEPNEYLADKAWLFVFPVISTTITVTHLLLLGLLRSHHKVMNQLFGWLTLIVQSLCVVAAVRIVSIIW
jgi:hypothetical protein